MQSLNPSLCVKCEVKCLDYQYDGGYVVYVKPTNWECENAKLLANVPAQKNGYYRYNSGGWLARYLEEILGMNTHEACENGAQSKEKV